MKKLFWLKPEKDSTGLTTSISVSPVDYSDLCGKPLNELHFAADQEEAEALAKKIRLQSTINHLDQIYTGKT